MIAQVILFGLLLGIATCAPYYPPKQHQPNKFKHHEKVIHHPKPYKFGYAFKDKKHGGGQFRHEESDGYGGVKGKYGYIDPHGIQREVHYVADKNGFRAVVKTNEPGTANLDPADVKMYSSAKYKSFPEKYPNFA